MIISKYPGNVFYLLRAGHNLHYEAPTEETLGAFEWSLAPVSIHQPTGWLLNQATIQQSQHLQLSCHMRNMYVQYESDIWKRTSNPDISHGQITHSKLLVLKLVASCHWHSNVCRKIEIQEYIGIQVKAWKLCCSVARHFFRPKQQKTIKMRYFKVSKQLNNLLIAWHALNLKALILASRLLSVVHRPFEV